MSPPALPPADARRLAALEQTISDGWGAFARVAQALLEIQRGRLYRATHATWDDYCRERWGIGRTYAWRLITAGQVAEDLAGLPSGQPPTERQARELAPLDADGRRQVWQEATAPGQPAPTAERLRQLTAKALASLPPDEQAEVIAAHEAEALRQGHAAAQVGGEGRAARVAQIERLAGRLRKLAVGLGDEAEAALGHLDAFLAAIAALPGD